jgi:4'-phosphopantetheinyl transferase
VTILSQPLFLAAPTGEQLPDNEAHVHWAALEAADGPRISRLYDTLLNAAERARYDQIITPRAQQEYLATRALVRTTLSRYTGVDPVDWVFRSNAWGRPEIVSPPEHVDLRFNASNTVGALVCAVVRGRDIGVDVENVEQPGETLAVAERFFSRAEYEDLAGRALAEQRARFFSYWTLKEAYLKARGVGLTISLKRFSLSMPTDGTVRVTFDSSLDDDGSFWQFAQFQPTPQHRLAVAVRRRAGPDTRVLLRKTALVAGLRDADHFGRRSEAAPCEFHALFPQGCRGDEISTEAEM